MKNKFSIIKKINPYEIIKQEETSQITSKATTQITNKTKEPTTLTESSIQESPQTQETQQSQLETSHHEDSIQNAEKITSLKSLFNKKEINRKRTCTFTLKKNNIEFLAKFSKATNISRSEILDKLIEALTKENLNIK
jgi:hypothetical protein